MPDRLSGLFLAEGSSDLPLAEIVESIFLDKGIRLTLSSPDFTALKVKKDVRSQVDAGMQLSGGAPVNVVVVHRDADGDGMDRRVQEIQTATNHLTESAVVGIIPVRMTEAWLLLDEQAIRQVAGNPKGSTPLNLPTVREAERVADPKALLFEVIMRAANVTGRRRERTARRFNQNRRQLLERLDRAGPVCSLKSWQAMVDRIDEVIESARAEGLASERKSDI
jgi:hypothetical protein